MDAAAQLNGIFINHIATLKNTVTEQVSNIADMSGAAIRAGSSLSFFARIGREQPSSIAKTVVVTRLIPVTFDR